jgi:NADH dehydrogenase
LDRSGRVEVQPDLSVPGHPNIFVIGDLANCSHQTGDPLPGVAQVAIQQGQYVGDLLKRKLKGKSVRPFHYRDRGSMATIGRGTAVAEIWRFRLGGLLAWQLWLAVHLMYQIEVQNRVLVFIQWVWNSLTRNRSAMLITNRQLSIQEERPLRVLETGTMTRV